VRVIWQVVERLDLSAFYAPIAARGSEPGRAATDPKLLVGLWLYAAVDADLKTFRGLHALTVRGLKKVRCAALWSALAYHVMHFAAVLIT